jgi:hypothetical protein
LQHLLEKLVELRVIVVQPLLTQDLQAESVVEESVPLQVVVE